MALLFVTPLIGLSELHALRVTDANSMQRRNPIDESYWPRFPSDTELQSAADTFIRDHVAGYRDNACHASASANPGEITKLHHKTDTELFKAHLRFLFTQANYPWGFREKRCLTEQAPVSSTDTVYALLWFNPASDQFYFLAIMSPLEEYWLPEYDVGWPANPPTEGGTKPPAGADSTSASPFPLWPVLIGVLGVLGVGSVIALIRSMLAARAAAGPASAANSDDPSAHPPNLAATIPISRSDIYLTPVPLQAHQQLAAAIAQALGADCVSFTLAEWNARKGSKDPAVLAALEARRDSVMRNAFERMQKSMNLRTPIKLVFENNPKGPYSGQYRPNALGGPELMIDKSVSQWDYGPHHVLDTLAHELEHVRQWEPGSALGDSTTRAVATKNAADFVEMETDFESYSEQFVERDASAFAGVVSREIAVKGYLSKLESLRKKWEEVKLRDSLRSSKSVWELSDDDLRLQKLKSFLKIKPGEDIFERLKPMIGTEDAPRRRRPEK
ncbi:MAG: hypothetical protein IPP90_15605 [Gemmatimonadaceae bacterium]|nr:hypothetical protein [Gemmatimonadaceae bacterium]